MDIFIVSVKCGECMDTTECVHLLHFLADMQYLESLVRNHYYISKSLETNVGIMIDNKLLGSGIRYGLLADAYQMAEKLRHPNFTTGNMISWLAYEGLGEEAMDPSTQDKQWRLKPSGGIVSFVFFGFHDFGAIDKGRPPFKGRVMVIYSSYLILYFSIGDQAFGKRPDYTTTRFDELFNKNGVTRQGIEPMTRSLQLVADCHGRAPGEVDIKEAGEVTTNGAASFIENGRHQPFDCKGWSTLLLYVDEMSKCKFMVNQIKESRARSMQTLNEYPHSRALRNQVEKVNSWCCITYVRPAPKSSSNRFYYKFGPKPRPSGMNIFLDHVIPSVYATPDQMEKHWKGTLMM